MQRAKGKSTKTTSESLFHRRFLGALLVGVFAMLVLPLLVTNYHIRQIELSPLQHVSSSVLQNDIHTQSLSEKHIYSGLSDLAHQLSNIAWVRSWQMYRM